MSASNADLSETGLIKVPAEHLVTLQDFTCNTKLGKLTNITKSRRYNKIEAQLEWC